ncbi:hypothetical protein HA402_010664 [Bradysia odoriphaga]|nr:hypothetical protein HA402_010664 [Bradysia odoriphaga]
MKRDTWRNIAKSFWTQPKMSTFYRLNYAQQAHAINGTIKIYQSGRPLRVYALQNNKLESYKYEKDAWLPTLLLKDLKNATHLHASDILNDGHSIVIVKTENGMRFYRHVDDDFSPTVNEDQYDVDYFTDKYYGWNEPGSLIKFGHFYSDSNLLGILTYRKKQGPNLYAVQKDSLESQEYPIVYLDKNMNILGNGGTFELSDLERSGQEKIITYDASGINIYRINKSLSPEHVMEVANSRKLNDSVVQLFFPSITGKPYHDIVLVNSTGLYVYQYSDTLENYEVVSRDTSFSSFKGWKSKHTSSIHFNDLDSDGRQEMIFTGPKGMSLLSFNNQTSQWTSLLDNSELSIAERYRVGLNIVPVSSPITQHPIIFTKDEKQLYWAEIVEGTADDPDREKIPEEPGSLKIPVIPATGQLINDKPTVLLRDQLDFSTIFKSNENNNGKPRFRLSLVDLSRISSNLMLNIFYDGTNQASDMLGVGWSMPQTFIIMDNQSSILPEAISYYVVLGDMSLRLTFDSSDGNVTHYKLSDDANGSTKVTYYMDEERWEIVNDEFTQTYGRHHSKDTDAVVHWSLRNKYSAVVDEKLNGTYEPYARIWYLVEAKDKYQNTLRYAYDTISAAVPSGKAFTKEIYPKSISDDRGNKITFSYLDKGDDEYELPPMADQINQGFSQRILTRYMSGYKLVTSKYKQDIDYGYVVENGKRFLANISQKNDFNKEPILSFNYENDSKKNLLKKVILPTGAGIEFSYELQGESLTDTTTTEKRFEVYEHYHVDFVGDHVVVSYLDLSGTLLVRIFNLDMSEELYSSIDSKTAKKLPRYGRGNAISYDIYLMDQTIAILLHYKDDKELYFLRWEEETWLIKPKCHTFLKEQRIRFGWDFVVDSNNDATSTVNVISWDDKSKDWKSDSLFTDMNVKLESLTFIVSDRMIVLYDNHILAVAYRNQSHEWQHKTLKKIPGVFTDIDDTLNLFHLANDARTELSTFFRDYALQISGNIIALSRWKADKPKLYTSMDFFVLDGNYNFKHDHYRVDQDDLAEFSQEIEFQGGSFYTFRYEETDGHFKVVAKSLRGKIETDLEDAYSNENRLEDAIEAELERMTKVAANFFLLNFYKYQGFLRSQFVVCSQKKFTFVDDNWQEDAITDDEFEQKKISVPLGKKFMLHKDNGNTTLKLCEQTDDSKTEKLGKTLVDLDVKYLNETVIGYPIYIAYQPEGKAVTVTELTINGSAGETFKLPQKEKLSSLSNYHTLVTTTSTENQNDLYLRHQLSLKRLLPDPVTTKVTLSFDKDSQRTIGYEYTDGKALGETVVYQKIVTIPNDNKSSFGWTEQIKNLTNPSASEQRIFDTQDQLVKTVPSNETEEDEAKGDDDDAGDSLPKTKLFDKTGKLEVAQVFPYNVTSEVIGYYGFEDYERNRVGNSSEWHFNQGDVVKNGFSFTGSNYLHLSTNSVNATFRPTNLSQLYLASCWMRSENKTLEIGDTVPYIKAVTTAKDRNDTLSSLGEVKFQFGDWFYVEAIVNMFDAGRLFVRLNETKATDTKTQTEQIAKIDLTTTVVVAPTVNTTIDVDHVRFTPIDTLFKAGVYDTETGRLKEIINASGLVERHFYDKYGNEIALVNGYGELKVVSTYTKSSSIDRISKLRCKITIQPELGFYEDFAPISFDDRWYVDSHDAWEITPGALEHLPEVSHTLQLKSNKKTSSYGLRLSYDLKSNGATILFGDNLHLSRETNNSGVIIIAAKKQRIPTDGELLVVIEGKRTFVFIDGGLYFDGHLSVSLYAMKIGGRMRVSDFVAFYKPSVQITYNNALGEEVQEILLANENASIVTEYLYDEIGRKTITTQPARIEWSNDQSVLDYSSRLVTNKNPFSTDAVSKTGKLQGDITQYLNEFDFNQVVYCNNPLSEKCAVGLPGKELSATSPLARRFSHSPPNDLFIQNLYPTKRKFRFLVEHKVGDVEDISVFDGKDNKVAWYIHTTRSKNLFSTYKYDTNGNLTTILSPLYHDKVKTLNMRDPHLDATTDEEKTLQEALGVHITYDNNGKILSKSAPDSGKVENIYDKDGFLRFAMHDNENVVYFDYDQFGRLRSTGEVVAPTAKDELLSLDIRSNATKPYQTFDYDSYDSEPLMRGNMARTVTFTNDKEFLIEETFTNLDDDCTTKRMFVPINNAEPTVLALNKRYKAGRLAEIEYPFGVQNNTLNVSYNYNKLGQVVGIGVPGKENVFASFAYNANGHITVETYLPESVKNFTRKYTYNSAGFLTGQADKFLTQKLYYTENGYGGYGYGDGTVTRTEFQATWHSQSDSNQLGLNEHSFVSDDMDAKGSANCFHQLKKAGYIDANGHQAKLFYPKLELNVPIMCSRGATGRHIQNVLGKNGFPARYGYSFDYGNYQELTKAKYFIEDVPLALQPETFSQEITKIDKTASRSIWDALVGAGYLYQDNDKSDTDFSHGRIAKSFINPKLVEDLKSIDVDEVYRLPLEQILTKTFLKKVTTLSVESFVRDMLVELNINGSIGDVTKIIAMLKSKGYLENPLSEEFKSVLEQFEASIQDIVRVMFDYFGKGLGEAEFDVESYSIDANGNHMNFFTGFDHYKLSYHNNTNKVDNVKFLSFTTSDKEQSFSVKHDNRGNVIQALHKGIKNIEYHPVTNRAIKMVLTNGNSLTFKYDAKGGRAMKIVTDTTGRTTKELLYVRDEFGRALVEHQLTYFDADAPPDVLVTAYIYGPRGLLGFIRKDEFYSVITDHQGSIRLVVKGDETVAAYDYLPYGNLMRAFGNDPDAQISYRYTGQEWDEEIGLYNYHSRFYDPSIGRFYQIDPMEQYFSPYKYAGNSPISMVDPNGEMAFLVIVPLIAIGFLVGAYLGGSAANNRWNPANWDLTSKGTWIGLIGGGIAGGFLPVGFAGSVSALASAGMGYATAFAITTTLGIGGAFLGMAAANHDFDPSKWNLKSPETWNAAFSGFALGSSLPAGVHGARESFLKLTSVWSKTAFIVGGVSFGTGSFVLSGIQSDWDFSRPDIYFGLLQAFDDATNFPTFIQSAQKSLSKSLKDIRKGIKTGRAGYSLLDGSRRFTGYKYATFAFAKMTSKVALMTSISLLLTDLHDGLDLSNPNTYFSIVRQMNSVNLHYSLAKRFYVSKLKPHSRIENERVIDEAVAETDGGHENVNGLSDERVVQFHFEVPRERVTEAGNHQMTPAPTEGDARRISELSKKVAADALNWAKDMQQKAPSTSRDEFQFAAIATAMSDDYTTVMFSGNDGGRGFVMLYEHPVASGTTFRKIGMIMLHDNSQISVQPLTHPVINQRVVDNDISRIATRTSDFYLLSQSDVFEHRVVLNPDHELNTIILDAMDNNKLTAIALNLESLQKFVNGDAFRNLPDIDGDLKAYFEVESRGYVNDHGGMTPQSISGILGNRLNERLTALLASKGKFDKALTSLKNAVNNKSRKSINKALDTLRSAMGDSLTVADIQFIRNSEVDVATRLDRVDELRQRFDEHYLEESRTLFGGDGSEPAVKETSDAVLQLKTNIETSLETLKNSIRDTNEAEAVKSIDSIKSELATAFSRSIDDSMKIIADKKQQEKKLTDDSKSLTQQVRKANQIVNTALAKMESQVRDSLKLNQFFIDTASEKVFNDLIKKQLEFEGNITKFKTAFGSQKVKQMNEAIGYFRKELGDAYTKLDEALISTGKTTDLEQLYQSIYQEKLTPLLKTDVDMHEFNERSDTKKKFESELGIVRAILLKGNGDQIRDAVQSLKRVAADHFEEVATFSTELEAYIKIKNQNEMAQRTKNDLTKQIQADELNLRSAADQLDSRFNGLFQDKLRQYLKSAEPVYQYETLRIIKSKMDAALDQLKSALTAEDASKIDAAMESLKDVADSDFRREIGDSISSNEIPGVRERIEKIYLEKLEELLTKNKIYSESLVDRLNDIYEIRSKFDDGMAKLTKALNNKNQNENQITKAIESLKKAFSDMFTSEIMKLVDTTDPPLFAEFERNLQKLIEYEQKVDALKLAANLRQRADQIATEIWSKMEADFRKDLLSRVPPWKPVNCAEPHAITAFAKMPRLFGVRGQQLKYLGTYRTENMNEFPACGHCQITTKSMDFSVITEPKEKSNVPRVDEEMPSTSRQRRSTFDKHSEHYRSIDDNAFTSEYKSDPITPETMPHSVGKNVFGWIKSGGENIRNLLGQWSTNDSVRSDDVPNVNLSQVDGNSTMLLLDMLIRKGTGQKHVYTQQRNNSALESVGYAIDITEKFEKIMKRAAAKSKLSFESLEIDFPKLQGEITGKIVGCKIQEILDILKKCAKNSIKPEEWSGTDATKMRLFMEIVDNKIEKYFAKILSKMTRC